MGAAVIRRDAHSQPPKTCIFKASLLKHKPIYQTRNVPRSYSTPLLVPVFQKHPVERTARDIYPSKINIQKRAL